MEGQKDRNKSMNSAVGRARSKSCLCNPLNVISKVLTYGNPYFVLTVSWRQHFTLSF